MRKRGATLEDLLEHYQRHAELRNTPRTVELNMSIIRRFIAFVRRKAGGKPASASMVTPALIEEFSLARKRAGRAAWTVNRELGAVSIFFSAEERRS